MTVLPVPPIVLTSQKIAFGSIGLSITLLSRVYIWFVRKSSITHAVESISAKAKITGQYPGSYLVRSYIFFQLHFFFRKRGSASGDDLGWSKPAAEPLRGTILFVAVSAAPSRLATDWAEDCDKNILRRCPFCERDPIIGHGRRRKQAHDEHHDWIWICRGRCADCGTTFTFLPLLSLLYTHFSLLARCQALLRRIAEHCSWEKASPKLKSTRPAPELESGLGCYPRLSTSREKQPRMPPAVAKPGACL